LNRSHSQLAWPLTLLVTGLVAALPAHWRLGWSTDIAEKVGLVFTPFTDAGTSLGAWLRPPPSRVDGLPGGSADIEKILENAEMAMQLYHEQRQRLFELEKELRQYKLLPEDVRRNAAATIRAYVTSRNPASPLGIVELRLERGGAAAVGPGTIAVYSSVDLLGRIVGDPRGSTCSLRPIVHPDTGHVLASIIPQDQPLGDMKNVPLIQLHPTGTGRLAGELDRTVVVNAGDIVRLNDPHTWPRTAQMMVVGVVSSVEVNDREPLLNTITVKPRFQVRQVATLTLIVEQAFAGGDLAADASGADAGGTTP